MNELALIGQPAFLELSMLRETGTYRISTVQGEAVRAFMPHALPPAEAPLAIEGDLADRHAAAVTSIGRLRIAGAMVPDPGWFLYGFVRKEAVLSSQIEGTQATLRDVATFEATSITNRPADVAEICNYVTALNHAPAMIADSAGLPLSARLLCDVHRILIRGWQHNGVSVTASVRISPADRDVSGHFRSLEHLLRSRGRPAFAVQRLLRFPRRMNCRLGPKTSPNPTFRPRSFERDA